MKYDTRYPAVIDLKKKARRRLPKFAYDYVDGGIDEEHGKQRNRDAWHDVVMTPRYLKDVSTADLTTEVFGHEYAMPFGVPPVGLGNMMWPGAELALARAAQRANIPYILSTFSTTDMAEIGRAVPDVGWFQLYVPNDVDVMHDLINRAKEAGFKALMVTLDIPVGAKRNRELKNGMNLPFRYTPFIVWECLRHPVWTFDTLTHGAPDFVNVMRYRERADQSFGEFLTGFLVNGVTRERVEMIRKAWDGPMVLKGVQYEEDFRTAMEIGIDGVVISNHGGRQLDAAPTSVESLVKLAPLADDRMTVMVDSGIRTGMDVVRARALGAAMAFSGRSFFWGMGALGRAGAAQVIEIYRDEIDRTLKQLGCGSIREMNDGWLAQD